MFSFCWARLLALMVSVLNCCAMTSCSPVDRSEINGSYAPAVEALLDKMEKRASEMGDFRCRIVMEEPSSNQTTEARISSWIFVNVGESNAIIYQPDSKGSEVIFPFGTNSIPEDSGVTLLTPNYCAAITSKQGKPVLDRFDDKGLETIAYGYPFFPYNQGGSSESFRAEQFKAQRRFSSMNVDIGMLVVTADRATLNGEKMDRLTYSDNYRKVDFYIDSTGRGRRSVATHQPPGNPPVNMEVDFEFANAETPFVSRVITTINGGPPTVVTVSDIESPFRFSESKISLGGLGLPEPPGAQRSNPYFWIAISICLAVLGIGILAWKLKRK